MGRLRSRMERFDLAENTIFLYSRIVIFDMTLTFLYLS
jgi:hypothetical protein